MAKAKFKIGTLVKIQDNTVVAGDVPVVNATFAHSEIDAVVTKKDGFAYQLTNGQMISESDVICAYKPIAAAKPRVKKPKAEAPPAADKKETKKK